MTRPAQTQAVVVWLRQPPPRPGFTARDRIDLERWATHGRRVVYCEGETESYAMLYDGVTPWALWAAAREEGGVVVWNCVTLADLGRFGSMAGAVAAVLAGSGEAGAEAESNVIPLLRNQPVAGSAPAPLQRPTRRSL